MAVKKTGKKTTPADKETKRSKKPPSGKKRRGRREGPQPS